MPVTKSKEKALEGIWEEMVQMKIKFVRKTVVKLYWSLTSCNLPQGTL